MINHVSVKDLQVNGSLKANVRLGGILVGTYRRRVSDWGSETLFLPGGGMFQNSEGNWKISEPIVILENGKFVNLPFKQEIDELCDVWWMRHKLNQEIDPGDEPVTRFVDRPWTEDVTVYVRPISYVSPKEAQANERPWDAGRAELVVRKDNLEMIVKIPIRRRATGVEASLPKWAIEKKDTDMLGREITTTEYVPKFHFQAGGGYIDSQILGAITIIWAWHFDVKEDFVGRNGTCYSCRHLKYEPEDKGLGDKNNPVGCKWLCTLLNQYIDKGAASSENVKRMYWSGQEALAYREAGLARFSHGCEQWEANGLAGLRSLEIQHGDKSYEYDEFTENGQLNETIRNLDELAVFFEAPGYHDPEYPEADVPSVSVWVHPLFEGAPGRRTEGQRAASQAPQGNSSKYVVKVPF